MKKDFTGLEKLQKNLKALSKKKEISFGELFPPDFMRRYTHASSIDDFISECGFKVETIEDFKAIPDDAFDAYVKSSTVFSSWREMEEKAHEEYIRKALDF